MILNALTDVINIGTITAAGILALVNSQSIKYSAGIVVLMALVSILFTPFTFYSDVNMPIEVMYLIRGFFNTVLLIAILQFITEKEW